MIIYNTVHVFIFQRTVLLPAKSELLHYLCASHGTHSYCHPFNTIPALKYAKRSHPSYFNSQQSKHFADSSWVEKAP